jgi:glycosyltransferase involved in cell wall biosynthesis
MEPVERFYRVTAIVANVKQFRKSFYSQLHDKLLTSNIELTVIYSDPDPFEDRKGDSIILPSPLGKKVPRCYFARNRALIQFVSPFDVIRSDLIIMVQANGYLINYLLLLLSALGLKKVAFWGHGRNHQGNANSLKEKIKRKLLNATDWWFAYTSETARYLKEQGVNGNKVSQIDNAVDTNHFRDQLLSISADELTAVRRKFGFTENDRIALYCGSLYEQKRIPFLVEAAQRISQQIPAFKLLIVGGGPEAGYVARVCENSRVVFYAGRLFGREKACCFKLAAVFLNPGLVGLAILDSFAAGLPLITSSDGLHSPEIAYLESGKNGLMLQGETPEYARAVASLLSDPSRLETMSANAKETAERFTVENMVINVSTGIKRALQERL